MEEEREGKRLKVRALIQKATTSTLSEVDPRLLKAIKSVVRYSDSELRLAAQTLLDLMKREHAQVRYLTLLIIDQLFTRSKLFRSLVIENMEQLLSLSVGFRKDQPLPAPPAVAALLRSKAIEFLEKWNGSFGVHYREIRLGFDYLKNTLRLQFPNIQENAARVQQERAERERRSKEILHNKYENLKKIFESMKEEIESTVREIGECLEIARSGEEQVALGPFDEEDFVEIRCSELREIRLTALEEGEKVHENSDNKVIFDTLRELYKLVVTKHLVAAQEWISVLVRVEATDRQFRDSALKEMIDIKNLLQSVKRECEEAGLVLQENNDEEEDIWEEGKIGPSEIGNSSPPSEGDKDVAMASTSRRRKERVSRSSGKKIANKKVLDRQSNSSKDKLLAEAPVVNWGLHLDDWGSNRDVFANQRGLELEGHWGRVDYDQVIPAEKIAELSIPATLYIEDRVDIQPCRAPLRKGGLCSRRDLKICPFHGPIIPRDDEGKPIYQGHQSDETNSDHSHDRDKNVAKKSETDNTDLVENLQKNVCEREDSPQDETPSDFGADLVENLARQAVKNVRERDKEAARKAQLDKQAHKRAKLAKVREHNASVLRDAALASTSRSANVGEDIGGNNVGNVRTTNMKQQLASMLKKKVTAKDRISRRLLNHRASEATVIQLRLNQDANYKEAFPNQW